MIFYPKNSHKNINILLICAILFEVFMVSIYLISILLTGKAYHPFDVDGIMTIPSLWQAFQLFLMGFMSIIFLKFKRKSQPPSRFFLLTIAIFFFYASVDEIFKIHLYLPTLIQNQNSHYWFKLLYFFIAIMIPFVFSRDFRALWRFHRRETLLALLGMGIFIFGAYITEIFKHEILDPLVGKYFKNGEFIAVFMEKLRIAVEEFGEMLGETIILYAILLFLAKQIETEASASAVKSFDEHTD